jgi:hypothetical protein
VNDKVEFLDRLLKLSFCYEDLIAFLYTEKVVSDFDLSTLKNKPDRSKLLVAILEEAKNKEKLLLLSYDWIVLPVERLKLTIITERMSKDFVYNYS